MFESRIMKWVGHVAHIGKTAHADNILSKWTHGMRPLGTEIRTCGDNIRMDLKRSVERVTRVSEARG